MIRWDAYPPEPVDRQMAAVAEVDFADTAPPGRVARLAFDPTGQFLVTMPQYDPLTRPPCRPATVWRADGTRVHDLPPVLPTADPTAVAIGPGGEWVAVGLLDYDTADSGFSVRLWDVAAARPLGERRPNGPVYDLRLLPDGGLLAATAGGVWRHPPGLARPPKPLTCEPDVLIDAVRVAASPTGDQLAGASKNRAVVWDAAGKTVASRDHKPSPQNGPVAFHPHAPVLAVGHGTVVDLWDFTADRVVTLVGHKRPVWAVGFGPDGGTVYTAASDGAVIAWDAAAGTRRQRFDFGTGKLYSAAVSPDGLTLALGGDDGRVTVVDVDG